MLAKCRSGVDDHDPPVPHVRFEVNATSALSPLHPSEKTGLSAAQRSGRRRKRASDLPAIDSGHPIGGMNVWPDGPTPVSCFRSQRVKVAVSRCQGVKANSASAALAAQCAVAPREAFGRREGPAWRQAREMLA